MAATSGGIASSRSVFLAREDARPPWSGREPRWDLNPSSVLLQNTDERELIPTAWRAVRLPQLAPPFLLDVRCRPRGWLVLSLPCGCARARRTCVPDPG